MCRENTTEISYLLKCTSINFFKLIRRSSFLFSATNYSLQTPEGWIGSDTSHFLLKELDNFWLLAHEYFSITLFKLTI